MDEIRVPIYLITGFLESGKTTFLRFTLDQDYFQIDGKTLLILMEEGEEEYDTKALAKNNTVVEVIEKACEIFLDQGQMFYAPIPQCYIDSERYRYLYKYGNEKT